MSLHREARSWKPLRIGWLSAFAVLGLLLWAAAPAHATFPGANGKIAFDSGGCAYATCIRGLFVMNPDGSGRTRLTSSSDTEPAWSSDGRKIAFTSSRDGNDEIYTMNADGTDAKRLTYNPAVDETPAWSPDGTKIAFTSRRDGHEEIYTMNADGTGQIRLTSNIGFDVDPAWSPDGTKIAFSSYVGRTFFDEVCDCYLPNSQIFTMNPDGTDTTNLTGTTNLQDFFFLRRPDWSPDGTRIAFEALTRPSAPDGWTDQIYTMSADGSGQARLTKTTTYDVGPSWSPDGTRIAFASPSVVSDSVDIYAMNADGGEPVNLTNNTTNYDTSPAWQPLVRSAFKNAEAFCRASRGSSSSAAFEAQYRTFGQCVRANR